MIMITDAALNHINKMLEKNQGIGFRLSVKKTGCSGYSYVPEIIEKISSNDICSEQQGLKLYLDPASEIFFKDLVIDYGASQQQGLQQKKLIFINPNEKNKCGCGESFTIE